MKIISCSSYYGTSLCNYSNSEFFTVKSLGDETDICIIWGWWW